jgi:hypothetical protein
VETKLSNLFINKKADSVQYKPIGTRGSEDKFPNRHNRTNHALFLKRQFNDAWDLATKLKEEMNVVSINSRNGIYLEILGKEGYDLITKSLEDIRQHVRICNIKHLENEVISTTVFIPNNKKEFFINKINKYKNTEQSEKVIGTIENINHAYIEALWMSDKDSTPTENPIWCEIWLIYEMKEEPKDIIEEFFELCELRNLKYKKQSILFPERVVVSVEANIDELFWLQYSICRIAEIRKMVTPSSFFANLSNEEQVEFTEDLLNRIEVTENINTSLCLLDTGVNNGHPLLSNFLTDDNMHTVDVSKGVHDKADHGTRMAGIATFYELEKEIESSEKIYINHILESVKILDENDDNAKELYGYITSSAISLAEINNPHMNRSICMAITSSNNTIKNDGRPSSWSGAIDSISSGVFETDTNKENPTKRLFFISAGNTHSNEIKETRNLIDAVINHRIENPGQAWNAITVGAYTQKYNIEEKYRNNYEVIAKPGNFSPYTSSSLMWSNKWPTKPDILLEGGNLAYDSDTDFYADLDGLKLLTTNHNFKDGKLFDTINMTSSATAQAAWIGSQIMHYYPDLWPETIRALIIHSANWTDTMKETLIENDPPKKSDYRKLLRVCGYGVPNLSKAIWSASNSVNLIIEDEIQPFIKKDTGNPVSKEMKLHEIPWPKDILLELEDTPVKMRITLSYFIEPGPGEIGWKDKYRYPSCGLQFDVNNTFEDKENFLKRINSAMRENKEDKGEIKNNSERWLIGINNRSNGSVHSDIWEGTASDLSESNLIAIYPTNGWWKTRSYLKRYNSKVRYSMIVSIETPEEEINLYSVIKAKIETPIKIMNKS